MNQVMEYLSWFYAILTSMYPYGFRKEFAREMQTVFWKKMSAQKEDGQWNLWRVFWKEIRDWPVAILSEYWFAFHATFRRGIMSLITEDKSWRIENQRDAIIASLPPMIFGIFIALGALVIWEPWYTIPRWRLILGFAVTILPGLFIGLGGVWALIRRIPIWGYTWVGGAVMGAVIFIKTLAEERADSGLALLSTALDMVLAMFLLGSVIALVLFTAWRGWRQAGLTSLGFATLAGMSSFLMATAAPFSRYDLALLAVPVGLAMSALTYLYVRKGDVGRVIVIAGYGVINAVVFLMVASIWDLSPASPSPVIPFLIVLTGALLIGPIAGFIGSPVRKIIQGS